MGRARRWIGWLIFIILALGLALAIIAFARSRPQDVPWSRLDLTQPAGMFTGRKLAALADDPPLCRALLNEAGIVHTILPPRDGGPQCSYRAAVRFGRGGSRSIGFAPADMAVSCPVAAALAAWEWHVVQPAAQRHFGSRVERIRQLGSYSCRRINNRPDGGWSEHATANAVDIAGFELADGRQLSILRDWESGGPTAAFLREVRDGACGLFATTLSPDYNAAHRDHLHLDQADRGAGGWRACS